MLRMMGQNEYGLYSLTSSVIAYLTVLDIGFNNAVIRYTAKYRAEKKVNEQYEMFGMFMIMYCSIAIIVLIIGYVFFLNIETLFGNTMTSEDIRKVKIMVILLVANVAFTFPMSIWGGIITAYENFVFQKLVNLFRVILNPITMILMLLMGYRAIGMVVVTTIFNVLTLSVNALFCVKKLHIKIRFGVFKKSFLTEVFVYSFWIFLSALVDRIYWSSGQFILGIFCSTIEIAIFAVAIQMQAFYTSFSYAISSLLLPKIVKLVTNKEPAQVVSNFFLKISRIQFYPISLILFGFILFGKQFIIYWAGEEYEPAYFMAVCFMVPQLFTTMQQTGYSVLQAHNKLKFRAITIFVVSLFTVIVAVPISKLYGGRGVAICIGLGLVLGNLILLDIYYQRQIGLNMVKFWLETFKLLVWPFTLTLVYSLILHFLPYQDVVSYCVHIIIYMALYVTGCVLLLFNNYEKETLLKPVKILLRR